MEDKKSSIVTQLVFVFTFAIVILNVVSLIFPALLLTSFDYVERSINPFELGSWTIPFFVVNLSILTFSVLYYRKHLPDKITSAFKFILSFEISRRTSIVAFAIIVGIYIIFSAGELTLEEGDTWADWDVVEPIVESFPYGEGPTSLKILYVNNFLLYASQEIFQNVKIIPFIASIILVFLTYFLTVKISQKRFAGLVAIVILLQSHTFLRYDTTATFSNFWTVFYLASIYLIYKKWYLSPLAYIASIFSKALTVAFIPMTLFFIYQAQIAKKTKFSLILTYLIIFVGIMVVFFTDKDFGYGENLTSFEYSEFLSGFTVWAFQLRIDGLVLVFLLPLIVGLFLCTRKGIHDAGSIMMMIAGIFLSAPFLAGFTEFNIQPYRWIPLITFFAIGVGTLLSKTSVKGPQD